MSFLVEKARKIALREHEALKIFMKKPMTRSFNAMATPAVLTNGSANTSTNPLISHALQQLKSALTVSSPTTQSIKSLWNRLYVGGVPFDLPGEDLVPIFEEFGFITSLIMQPLEECKVKRHKGYGFVEFREAEAALTCLNSFAEDPLKIGDRPIKVERNSNWTFQYPTNLPPPLSTRVYFSSFHPSIGEEDLLSLFLCFGRVTQLLLSTKGGSKCGFCDFEDEEGAKRSLSMSKQIVAGKSVSVVGSCLWQREKDADIDGDVDFTNRKFWISVDLSMCDNAVLVLKDILTTLTEDLKRDVEQECKKIGGDCKVSFKSSTIANSAGTDFYDAIIEFTNPLMVDLAYDTFNGRYFDGRKIKAIKK